MSRTTCTKQRRISTAKLGVLCPLSVLVLVSVPLCSARAQTAFNSSSSIKRKTSGSPDLSGFWERRDESGSGSFGGVSGGVPPAQVTPQAKKLMDDARARQQAGYVVSFASRYCQYLGMPF